MEGVGNILAGNAVWLGVLNSSHKAQLFRYGPTGHENGPIYLVVPDIMPETLDQDSVN